MIRRIRAPHLPQACAARTECAVRPANIVFLGVARSDTTDPDDQRPHRPLPAPRRHRAMQGSSSENDRPLRKYQRSMGLWPAERRRGRLRPSALCKPARRPQPPSRVGGGGGPHRRHPALPSQRRNAEWFLCHNAACRVESYRTQQAEPCPPGCSAQSGTDLSCGSAGRYPLALSGPDGADVAGRKQAQTEHRTVTQTVLTGCAPRNEVAAATTSQAEAGTENCFRTDRGSAIHPRVILIRGEPRCLRQSGAVNPSGLAPVVRR